MLGAVSGFHLSTYFILNFVVLEWGVKAEYIKDFKLFEEASCMKTNSLSPYL
jgi:hypothetical protein